MTLIPFQTILKQLSADLGTRFGRGFSERNLEQMRLFYLAWPISQTLSAKSQSPLDRPAFAHYTLENLPNKVLAAKYHTLLPDQKLLTGEIERTRKMLEARRLKVPTKKKRAQ